jgi:putative tryptophan/tyrosine transport system substrate-binding protein
VFELVCIACQNARFDRDPKLWLPDLTMQSCRKAVQNFMTKALFLIAMLLTLSPQPATGQAAKPHRIGVIHPGGSQYETLDGLRDGLKELGLNEGKQLILDIRDLKGDAAAADKEAASLERENATLIYALTTTVIAKAKEATSKVPIVFAIGSDPVTGKLVDSFARPGGRLTGVHYLVRDLTGKRLEILKEILPKISRVLTFYDPTSRVAAEGAALARDEAKRHGVKLIERHVRSVDDVKSEAQKLKAGEADAFLFTPDPMVGSQSQLIIDSANAKKLPTMFQEQTLVTQGALAAYGQNYREIGWLSARYVQQVLNGANPRDLKIETVDSVELAINLKTAKQLGVSIPPQVLTRAKKVVK